MSPAPEPNPLRRTARSIRSGLRRYPRAIIESLLDRDPAHPVGVSEMLGELAPHDLAVAWLGHAGVVGQLGETVLVIDPVLSHRIGPQFGSRTVGLPRRSAPPIAPAALRGVDAVLISHAHFDHLDKPTLAAMANADTVAIAPRGCRRLMPDGFAGVIELAPGERTTVGDVELLAIQPKHWGARVAVDRARGVNSYLARSSHGSLLLAGDTAETRVFDHLDDVDIAVFGVGAYDPWEHMHATPEQVWRMFTAMGARYLMPVHHSTFELSDEPMDDPMRRLMRAAGDAGERVLACEPGDVVAL